MAIKDPEAQRAYQKAYYAANRESELAKDKAYREANREVLRARAKAHRERNLEKDRARSRLRNRVKAGVVGAHAEAREGPCEICATECKLVLDHDHATGIFRGWLCQPCNKGLGGFKDDPALLRNAATYIEKSKTCPMQS